MAERKCGLDGLRGGTSRDGPRLALIFNRRYLMKGRVIFKHSARLLAVTSLTFSALLFGSGVPLGAVPGGGGKALADTGPNVASINVNVGTPDATVNVFALPLTDYVCSGSGGAMEPMEQVQSDDSGNVEIDSGLSSSDNVDQVLNQALYETPSGLIRTRARTRRRQQRRHMSQSPGTTLSTTIPSRRRQPSIPFCTSQSMTT